MTTSISISTSPVLQEPVRKEPVIRRESHVTEDSLLALTKGCPIVVSYGYTGAGWNETTQAMKRILGNSNLWDFGSSQFSKKSSSGEDVIRISIPEVDPEGLFPTARGSISARRQFKAGLINPIFHNYRMFKKGINDFVPIIFSVSLSYASGEPKAIDKRSTRFTCSEIEISRKLCTDTDLPKDFRETARRSVKFIDVQDDGILDVHTWDNPDAFTRITTYSFKEVDAPWEVDGYAEHRALVKATWLGNNPDFQRPAGSKGLGAPRSFGWKEQLLTLMDPDTGLIPGPDEVQPEVSEETTTVVNTSVETTPTTQEESIPMTQKTETVIVSEG